MTKKILKTNEYNRRLIDNNEKADNKVTGL